MTKCSLSDLPGRAITIEPISVRIPTAVAISGFSRSRIYELIALGELEIAKDRRTTLVVVASLRAAVARRVVQRAMDGRPTFGSVPTG